MSLAEDLHLLLSAGVRQIGELAIQKAGPPDCFLVCHHSDAGEVSREAFGDLDIHHGTAAARHLSTYTAGGAYRFSKAETSLRNGWVMILESLDDLRFVLDQFYPASLGIFVAALHGNLEIEHLRAKLGRQTGMYRYARKISDAGAQRLVREVCGPSHHCARKILWQLDEGTPLEESAASRFNGIVGDTPPTEAIPLLCREACNHFVAECRKASQQESTIAVD